MGILDTLGKLSPWRGEAERIEKDASEKLGTFVWQSRTNAIRSENNGELILVMHNPTLPIEYRVMAALKYVEDNVSFMEPKEDEHTSKALYDFNEIVGKFWMPWVDTLIFLERQLPFVQERTQRQLIENFRMTLTINADKYIIAMAKSLVDNKSYSKIDHVPNTIVVAHSVPQPMMGQPQQAGWNIVPTGNLSQGVTKPSGKPLEIPANQN